MNSNTKGKATNEVPKIGDSLDVPPWWQLLLVLFGALQAYPSLRELLNKEKGTSEYVIMTIIIVIITLLLPTLIKSTVALVLSVLAHLRVLRHPRCWILKKCGFEGYDQSKKGMHWVKDDSTYDWFERYYDSNDHAIDFQFGKDKKLYVRDTFGDPKKVTFGERREETIWRHFWLLIVSPKCLYWYFTGKVK